MYFLRVIGTFAVIPTALLLTMSFFVLLAVENTPAEGLRIFGYFVALFLWITAALVFFAGLFLLVTGKNPLKPLLQRSVKEQAQNP